LPRFPTCATSGAGGKPNTGRLPRDTEYPRLMLLLGIPIGDDDARRLNATLLAEGTPDALTAAERSGT